jgi:hypothetical protein
MDVRNKDGRKDTMDIGNMEDERKNIMDVRNKDGRKYTMTIRDKEDGRKEKRV